MALINIFHLHLIQPELRKFLKYFVLLSIFLLFCSPYLEKPYLSIEHWLQTKKKYLYFIGIISFSAFAYYLATDILLYRNFYTYIYDFGFFNQAVWKIAHNQSYQITLGLPFPIHHFLGDHFQPILYLVGCVYAIFSTPYTLFVLEVATMLSGVIPLILLCKKYRASASLSIALTLSYCWSLPTFYALTFSFHPFTLLPSLLLWVFYLAETTNWKWYSIAIILALSTKEDVGYYIACFGIWQLAFTRQKIKGALTAIAGLSWSLITIHYGITYFRQGPASNFFVLDPHLLSNSNSLLKTTLHEPSIWPQVITSSSPKWDTLITSFGAFGFLPLLNPLFLPILPVFAERLLSSNPNHWAPIYQYGAPLAAVMSYMTLRSISYLNKHFPKQALVWPLLIALGLIGTYKGYNATFTNFSLLYRQLQSERTLHLSEVESLIPASASVCAQDYIGTHLSARNDLYFLSNVYDNPPKCTFITLDPTLQFYPLPSADAVGQLGERINSDQNFSLIYNKGTIKVWKRR